MKKIFTFFVSLVLVLSCLFLTGCSKDSYEADITFGTYAQASNGKKAAIEWDILEEKDGMVLIISHYILDVRSFDEDSGNNYKESDLRKWLNDDFYNTAFTDEEKAKIVTTFVDNSVESTGYENNRYICESTEDKIFVLSVKEAEKYYTDETRLAKCTAYAKKQGLYVSPKTKYSWWWLRSPLNTNVLYVRGVSEDDGKIGNFATGSLNGVRPACWIKR